MKLIEAYEVDANLYQKYCVTNLLRETHNVVCPVVKSEML